MIEVCSKQVAWLRIIYHTTEFYDRLSTWEKRNGIYPIRVIDSYPKLGLLEAIYTIKDAARLAAWMSETMIGQVSWVEET